jgi:DNA mismatch repair protein MSH5
MHTWHLRPLLDLREIADRHDAIDLFNHPDNQFASSEIIRLLKHVCNMSTLLGKIKRGAYRWSDWKRLMDVSCLSRHI